MNGGIPRQQVAQLFQAVEVNVRCGLIMSILGDVESTCLKNSPLGNNATLSDALDKIMETSGCYSGCRLYSEWKNMIDNLKFS